MAPGNADLIRPIYEEWGSGNWRPRFDVYRENAIESVRTARSEERGRVR